MSWKQRKQHGRDQGDVGHFRNKSRRPVATDGNDDAETDGSAPTVPHDSDTTNVLHMFEQCQRELDARYDKHERLVKKSRDVTIEAKRIIFLLHRIIREDQKEDILSESERRLRDLRANLLRAIAEELAIEDPYLFLRAYSPGIQEYIEALSYYHYLREQRLISYQEVQSLLVFKKAVKTEESDEGKDAEEPATHHDVIFHLPPSEYILGVADLTGELMRRCINCIGAGNLSVPFELRTFLRQILEGFTGIGNSGPRDIKSKLQVLRQSVDKVENACYAIQVRRGEFPDCKLNPEVLLLGGDRGEHGGIDRTESHDNGDHF